jgi:hypothetical protein
MPNNKVDDSQKKKRKPSLLFPKPAKEAVILNNKNYHHKN